MKELCIDVRMAFNSGIGTYIRNIVSMLKSGPFKLTVDCQFREVVQKWPDLASLDLILTSAPIYSVAEQVMFPFLVPRCDLFWSPHYNTPLMPLRCEKKSRDYS